MSALFVDTAGWGHLFDSSQPYHSLAATIYRTARQEGRDIVTTNYIIVELTSLLTNPLRIPRKTTVALIEGLKSSPYIEVLHVDPKHDEKAWQFFKGHQDKEWSLVDCASFVIMKERGSFEALTTDHHFEQAGFVRLLND